ncbi:MAG TPA: hypothetical protein VGD65_09125 [Chryseosolibacter sp.]
MVLYAGPLQMLYERGFVRYIGYQDSEILRMIYFALRDENWDTCEHVILREEKDITWETFTIHYESVSRQHSQDLIRWDCRIEGSPDSSIRFTIHGEVLKDIKKNRAGFCVLHPLKNVTGQPVEIVEASGSARSGYFPVEVAPRNPFRNIRKLKWNFENKWYELSFEGDVFETEDQRNWIDTSFKTFCTPSDLPIPVTLVAGTQIFQRVTFRPLEKLQPITSHQSTIIQLDKSGERTKLPAVGVFLAEDHENTATAASQLIRQLGLDHLAIEVNASSPHWVSALSRQCEFAHSLALPLSIKFHAGSSSSESLQALALLIQQNRLNVKDITFLSGNEPVTSAALLQALGASKNLFMKVEVGAGTLSDFKNINRHRFDAAGVDFISYGANPQVHAFDDRTLIENIDGFRETGKSAASIYQGKAIHISPVSLRDRSMKVADPRQKTEFAALWAFGALRAAAEGRVSSLTLFETTGDKGIVSAEGVPYPVFSTLEKLLRFRNHEMVVLKNSEPLLIDAMLLTNDSYTTLLLVNYTDDLQTVRYGRNEFQVAPLQMHEVNLSGT